MATQLHGEAVKIAEVARALLLRRVRSGGGEADAVRLLDGGGGGGARALDGRVQNDVGSDAVDFELTCCGGRLRAVVLGSGAGIGDELDAVVDLLNGI